MDDLMSRSLEFGIMSSVMAIFLFSVSQIVLHYMHEKLERDRLLKDDE